MNTEQLKQAALAATPGPWRYFDLYANPEVRTINDALITSVAPYRIDEARYIAAANPAVILALLECVDALQRIADPRNTHFAGDAQVVARAALQKLEAL